MKLPSKKRLFYWLLFAFPLAAPAQHPAGSDIPRAIPLAELFSPCTSSPNTPCEILLASPTQTVLRADERLPKDTKIRFTEEASWTLIGGTIDFDGAIIDAPADAHVLKGSARMSGLSIARPEWFADPVDGVYPAEALARAYLALRPGGTILLSNSTYLSPFFDPVGPLQCGGRAVVIRTPVALVGTGRPLPDSDSAPTRLVNGSVIRGEICGFATVRASHLGVDAGPFAVDHHFAGKQVYGIQLGNAGSLGQVQGTILEDVSVLTTGLDNQHSVIIEGQSKAAIRGLWIWTLGGTHGLVMKSSASTIEDFHCKGASSDCLILKSDYATDRAGDASGSRVDGVFISFLAVPGDTAGILLDGSWDSLRKLQLSHIVETGLRNGISGFDSVFHEVSNVQIGDWSATGMMGPCLALNGSRRVTVDRFVCSTTGIPAGPSFILRGHETLVRDGTIRCEGKGGACGNVANDGVLDLGHDDTIEAVTGENLGGFLVRTSPHRHGTAIRQVDPSGNAGRVAVRYQPPTFSFQRQKLEWLTLARQTFRIAWTAATTRVNSLSSTRRFLMELLLPGITVVLFVTWLLRGRSM